MPILTQSMEQWLWEYHRDKITLIMFGHIEEFTEEMAREYVEWCKTEEGRQYLVGGSKYDPNHRGNIASAKARECESEE